MAGTIYLPAWYTSGAQASVTCLIPSDAARMASILQNSPALGTAIPTQVTGNSDRCDLYWTSTPWPSGTGTPQPLTPPSRAQVTRAVMATGIMYRRIDFYPNVEGGPW
jgi:hypothetical protein